MFNMNILSLSSVIKSIRKFPFFTFFSRQKKYESHILSSANHYLNLLDCFGGDSKSLLPVDVNVDLEHVFASCTAICDMASSGDVFTERSKRELLDIRNKAIRKHPNFTLWKSEPRKGMKLAVILPDSKFL